MYHEILDASVLNNNRKKGVIMKFLNTMFSSKTVNNVFVFFIFLAIYNVILNINMRENAFSIVLMTFLYWIVNSFFMDQK